MSGEITKEAKRNPILHFISAHPFGILVAFIGALSSIIALGPAFFPWWTSPKRDLTYCVNPIRTPIVQSAKSSDVAVSYRGTPISGNLTAAQIAIWNAGREPIKLDDILSPITLRTTDGCRIFEAIMSKTNSVTQFRFQQSSNEMETGKLVMNWRILERGDGALIQIVYAGTTETPITLEGTTIGQRSPHKVTGASRKTLTSIQIGVMIAIFLLLILFLLWGDTLLAQTHWLPIKQRIRMVVVEIVVAGIMVFLIGYVNKSMNSHPPITPFGF